MSEQTSSSKVNFLLGFFSGMAIIAVVAFFVLLFIVFNNKEIVNLNALAKNDQAANQPADTGSDTVVKTAVPALNDSDYFVGNKDAKVVLVEYTDFECPFCLKHSETSKKIKEMYGNKILFVLRHFPLSFHENAQKAAEAAECAGEQGKFWQMYDVLFTANANQNMGVAKWKSEAVKLGMNAKQFNDCLDSSKYAKKIADEQAGGAAAGVDGTPATFINGQLVSGAVPFEQFQTIIDGLLK